MSRSVMYPDPSTITCQRCAAAAMVTRIPSISATRRQLHATKTDRQAQNAGPDAWIVIYQIRVQPQPTLLKALQMWP
jgi:sarcosine oxidase gamma subunit